MADSVFQIETTSSEDEIKEGDPLEALSNVKHGIGTYAEDSDLQPLKLQNSESGQFDNCMSLTCESADTPESQNLNNRESHTPPGHQISNHNKRIDETMNAPCEATPTVGSETNDILLPAECAAVSSEQLHADLNSIICELQRIATEASETNLFQESEKCLPNDNSSCATLGGQEIEFLNSVMEDLNVMAESIELDLDDATNRSDHSSVVQESALVHHDNSDAENQAETIKNGMNVDDHKNFGEKKTLKDASDENSGTNNLFNSKLSKTDDIDSPFDQAEMERPSDYACIESESGAATAARKRYASTKSRKVENQQEHKEQNGGSIDHITSNERSPCLNEEPPRNGSKSKQSKLMQFLTGNTKRAKDQAVTSQIKKTSSMDLNVAMKKEFDEPTRPLSMPKEAHYHIDFARIKPKTDTLVKSQSDNASNSQAIKYEDIVNTEIKQRDSDFPNARDSQDDGTTNFAFVESPYLAEVHVDRHGKGAAAAAGAISDGDDNDDDVKEVVLDMEQLLSKLDLSDKIKRQIRQANQLSIQHQANIEKRTPRDIKRWRSLDNPTYNRATSEPSPPPPNPFKALRPWKIPMAIKMMKNLRKQQSSVEEDRLSLEFFVPGKKTTIRLHRRTFFNFLLKYSIFFFTFIFWIGSLSCISYGAWMLTHKSNIIDDVTDVFLDPYVLLCVVGAVVFIVAFIGCLGALRENIYLLKIFHISLTLVVVLEVFVGTLVFLFYTMPEFRTAVKVGPEEVLKSAVKRYFDDEVMQNWIDTVQKEFGCCGVSMSNEGYLDWQENQYFNCSDSNPSMHRCSVPLSCCIFEEGDFINYMCGAGIIKEEPTHIRTIINTKGCMKSFGEWLAKNDSVIGFAGLGLIGLQILGVVSGRYFIEHLREFDPSTRQQSDRIQIGPAEETPDKTVT